MSPIDYSKLPRSALVDARAVRAICGFGRTSVWRKVKSGDIPKPIKVGGMTRWQLGALLDALDKLGGAR